MKGLFIDDKWLQAQRSFMVNDDLSHLLIFAFHSSKSSVYAFRMFTTVYL